MTRHTFTTSATEPIEFSESATTATSYFEDAFVITSSMLSALQNICPCDTSADNLAQSGRDWWPRAMNWALRNRTPQRAGVVCRPTSVQQVSALAIFCNEHHIPITAAGGRSAVTGAAVPLRGGVALDMTSLQGIESVDTVSGLVEVWAGTFGPDMEAVLQEQYQLTVGHFPQSFDISTVGGWVACRGAGQYSTRYGKIEDMVAALEVVLADGTIIHTGGAPAGAVGPDLTQIFLGSEGTLGIITKVWLRAHPKPHYQQRAAYTFASFADGINAVRTLIRDGATPAVLRLYDGSESKRSHGGDGTTATLLVLDEANQSLVETTMSMIHEAGLANNAVSADAALVEAWMHHRNDTSALQALTRKGFVVDTLEVAASWNIVDAVVKNVESAILAIPHARSATCHLSHSYLDGACLYFTFAATPPEDEFDSTYQALWDAGQHAALNAGANLSHHHGVGLNRARFMKDALGSAFVVLQALKTTLDPHNILNPGKLGFK
ncbi:MAG: FAD-binding oxidoreductase [Ilumatobacteraceae bacterium]|nr:FAD-binding oxidoreductase [Ilumatobacteraceae bacterium]